MFAAYTVYKGRICGVFMERNQIKEQIVSAACMPKDVIMSAAVMRITGNFEICIGNYRGITEYTEELVRIQTKCEQIRVTGEKLCVEYYTNYEMKITGKIQSIEFCDGRKS